MKQSTWIEKAVEVFQIFTKESPYKYDDHDTTWECIYCGMVQKAIWGNVGNNMRGPLTCSDSSFPHTSDCPYVQALILLERHKEMVAHRF